jgi:putative endonuclease
MKQAAAMSMAMAKAERRAAEHAGREAEQQAARWLTRGGWQLLAQRVRTPAGEVDLIVKRGRLVAFVEVKARKDAATLADAIDHRRLARVAAAAEILYPIYCPDGEDARIDVVLIAPGCPPRHLPNVWHGA